MRLMPVCICARARRPLTRGGAAGGEETDRGRPLHIETDAAMKRLAMQIHSISDI